MARCQVLVKLLELLNPAMSEIRIISRLYNDTSAKKCPLLHLNFCLETERNLMYMFSMKKSWVWGPDRSPWSQIQSRLEVLAILFSQFLSNCIPSPSPFMQSNKVQRIMDWEIKSLGSNLRYLPGMAWNQDSNLGLFTPSSLFFQLKYKNNMGSSPGKRSHIHYHCSRRGSETDH